MDIKRRAFLSKMGTAGVGVGVVGLAGCNSSSSSSSGAGGCPVETHTASGSYSYDADTRELSLTVTDSGFPANCEPQLNDEHTIVVRGLMSDAMYWLAEDDDRDRLLQWVRTPGSDGEITGSWQNNYGYTLTLQAGGAFELQFSGCGCDSYGFAGIAALADSPFQQGVASGDPSANGFIIWTRDDKASNRAVEWEVSLDPLFGSIVKSGSTTPHAGEDYTLKEVLTGLSAGTVYYYRFSTGSDLEGSAYRSMVGRAKTLPAQNTSVAQLKFGVVSCSSYPHGFFVAYRNVARRDDLDCVLHLGDYIYEYTEAQYGNEEATSQGRVYAEGNSVEILTLADYRARYKRHREDPDLQMLHTRYAFITTWDDHETADNSWDPDGSGPDGGAVNHDPETEGVWESRKATGVRVYNEWMPITEIADVFDPKIHRSFIFGNLMELMMLDTRIQGRHQQPEITTEAYNDEERRLISAFQEEWLKGRLGQSLLPNPRTWKVFGQQVQIAPVQAPPIFTLAGLASGEFPSAPSGMISPEWANVLNTDTWDGYNANRQRIWDHIATNEIDNVVVLTGDIHTSWAAEMQKPVLLNASLINALPGGEQLNAIPEVELQGPKYGVEFVTPSITSPGLEAYTGSEGVPAAEAAVTAYNPHIKYVDLSQRGYLILEVTPEATTSTWYHQETIFDKNNDNEREAAKFQVAAGSHDLQDLSA